MVKLDDLVTRCLIIVYLHWEGMVHVFLPSRPINNPAPTHQPNSHYNNFLFNTDKHFLTYTGYCPNGTLICKPILFYLLPHLYTLLSHLQIWILEIRDEFAPKLRLDSEYFLGHPSTSPYHVLRIIRTLYQRYQWLTNAYKNQQRMPVFAKFAEI